MKTIQYMGSKKNLLEFIDNSINNYVKKDEVKIFYDAFSGSGRVAYYFKDKYKIITSDKQHFTKIINEAYLNNNIPNNNIDKYIEELNNLDDSYFEETDKWYTKNYSTNWNNGVSIGKDNNPKIWLTKNAKKIDMIRNKIDDKDFLKDTIKDIKIKNVLLLSLILAINKVSNVVGHQNGYLKKWCKNAENDLILENPNTYRSKKLTNNLNLVGDIYDILPTINADLIYFDPPYGTNNETLSVATRYSSFYHLWNTLVKNDRPKLFGKAGKPIETKGWTPDLEKNKKSIIIEKFKELIEMSNSKYVAFSYSNQGLLSKEDFFQIFKDLNCINPYCYEKKHKMNTQSKIAIKEGKFINRKNHLNLIEYFFILEKKKLNKKDVINDILNQLNNNLQDNKIYYSKSLKNILTNIY